MASLGEATAKVASALPRSLAGNDSFRGIYVLMLSAAIGIVAGLTVTALGSLVRLLHVLLFRLHPDGLLSAQYVLVTPSLALLPCLGGLLMGLSTILARRFRTRPPVDPIEANAVHGGRLSVRESLIVTAQTVISSSFGASVGLEAGYTQINAALASNVASRFRLRRNEVRMLVGCGAAGAIAAAFNAPLTGAFYGFEIIIGIYSPSLLAPVIVSALAASLTSSRFGMAEAMDLGHLTALRLVDVLPFLGLGFIGGGVAIAIMWLVTLLESGFTRIKCPPFLRPAIGGLVVGGLALVTPQVLSSGHGALAAQLTDNTASMQSIALLFSLKIVASIVSLGSGFRGGLFFASLFLGALLGKFFAAVLIALGIAPHLAPQLGALVGMASLAVGVVGGPLTMTFLVLETTGDLAISAAVLAASVMASFLVRETFGYSFSTWRLHLRGETLRGAHDVGRLRSLTVGALMRSDVRTAPLSMPISTFCEKYPLGSTERVIAVDAHGRYAGIVLVADAHQALAQPIGETARSIAELLQFADWMLLPSMNAQTAADLFAKSGAEELAVIDGFERRRVVGLVTEAHLLRRYAEELDKGWRDLTGETS